MNIPKIDKCPECGSNLESGYVLAPSFGICWTNDPDAKWVFGSKMEKLHKDSWGFSKLRKDALPAKRCPNCKLVVFRYTADASQANAKRTDEQNIEDDKEV